MSTTNRLKSRTIVAGNDFRTVQLYRAVDVTGDFSVANGHRFAGLAQSRCNSGQFLTVADMGDAKGIAGAVVTTPGYPLTTAASGFLVAAVSGSTIVARYWPPSSLACASGDMIAVSLVDAVRQIGAGSGYA